MPVYGVSRVNTYQSYRPKYHPLRGENTLNHDDLYSSLQYQSTKNRYRTCQPTPTTNQYTNSSFSHCANNPYLSLIHANRQKTHNAGAINPVSNLPDLSKTRIPPQPIATPRTKHRSMQTQPQTEDEQEEQSTNGWNFTVFGLLQSAWCKLVGASKKTTSNRQSMSQPPRSPLHDQPPNPYRITNTIPQNRPATAPITRAIHAPLVCEMTDIPVTLSLSQTPSNTATADNNDDAKSHNTSGKT
eukprot:280614_1